MRVRTIATLLAVLLLAGAAIPLVATAQDDENEPDEDPDTTGENDSDAEEAERDEDDDRDDEDDEREEREESRKVEVSTSSEGVEIELEREDASGEDKVEMSFDTEDAEFEIKYEAEAGENETEQKLEAAFQTLAEYRDTNNNSAWDPGEPIVSAWALGDDDVEFDRDDEAEDDEELETTGQAVWATPTVEDVTVDNKTGKLITAPASLGENGTFELRFYVFGDFVDIANSTLAPTSVKIDIVIEHYPYQANDTALALFMETKTELEQEHERDDGDDEEGVSASSHLGDTDVTLRFTWKDHASVDGTEHPVHTTVLETEEETKTDEDGTESESKASFALSYARGDSIVHDPEASVDIQSAETAGPASTPGWTAALALGVVGLTALAARARRR